MPATNSASPRLSVRVHSGGVGIGGQLCCWSSHASPGYCHGASRGLNPACIRNVAGVPGAAGGLAARVGGARVVIGAIRVTFWGALAMALTAGVGWLFGHLRERAPSNFGGVRCPAQTLPS